jgi:hypothetical protein
VSRVLAGRYELEVPLGRGASGEVWRGRDRAARKPVAVKLIELAQIDDPALLAETIARFRREAVTLAKLQHPNIVAALEAGRLGNELFLVMELAEGTSLASMLEQREENNLGLLPVSSVLRIAEQTCAGLAAAHSAGVVHRDIKPSNLMVDARLSIKIIDFGIARLMYDNSARLTLPAQPVGTLAYMSPEQVRNRDVDGRADLYSLGCVLYEQLTGRPPFVAEVPHALLRMHVQERAVPVESIRSDLPIGLARLVDRLLEKDRSARPANATHVLRNIAAINATADRDRPAQEADRGTVKAALPRVDEKGTGQHAGAPADGSGENLPPAARVPEADRSTKLAPARQPGAAAAEQAVGRGAQPSFVPRDKGGQAQGAPAPRTDSARRDDPRPPAQRPASGGLEAAVHDTQFIQLPASATRGTEPRVPVLAQQQAGQRSGTGDQGGQLPGGPPPRPTTSGRRWRPSWLVLAIILLILAIAVSVGAYLA